MQVTRYAAMVAMVVATFTIAIKFYAYRLTLSVGMLSDAVESCLNFFTALMAYCVLSVSSIPEDENHQYGHGKAEYFSSGITGLLIMATGVGIAYAAIQRLLHPQGIASEWSGILLGILSSVLNFILIFWMKKVAKTEDSIALEAEAKHLMSDIWTTGAVVLGLLIIAFFPSANFIDSIIAILIALHVVFSGLELVKTSVDGLMDAALPITELQTIENSIQANLPANISYQHLRTRKSGNRRFIEFKLYFPGDKTIHEAHNLSQYLRSAILNHFPGSVVNVYLEPQK
ncbi:MAG: cation diffusion facilitator family transporter [Gammaproteobacteria bacterium]